MALQIHLETDYSAIHLIYPATPPQVIDSANYYYNNELVGIFSQGGGGGQPGYFDKDLVFKSINTSLGVRYIFTIYPADVGVTSFADGLHHFESLTSDGIDIIGVIVDKDILCCLAKKLQEINSCGPCDVTTVFDEINNVNALIVAGNAAIRSGSPTTAMCALDIINNYCNSKCSGDS